MAIKIYVVLNYVCYITLLQQDLTYGYCFYKKQNYKKNAIMKFKHSRCLEQYSSSNTYYKCNAENDFVKDIYPTQHLVNQFKVKEMNGMYILL